VAGALVNLSAALQARYELRGSDHDLRDAVRHAREAMSLTKAGEGAYAIRAGALVNALRLESEADDDLALLDEAVALAQSAVDATPARIRVQRATRLTGLSLVLTARAELGWSAPDADAAVECLRQALALLGAAHPSSAAVTADLAVTLHARYELQGQVADLDEAVRRGREAAGLTRAGHPDRARYLSNHGAALHSRFEVAGDSADLDAAVEVLREAVDATPPADARRAARWANLSSALRERHAVLGARADAAEAVAAARAAAGAVPAGHADRPSYLTKLALALAAESDAASDSGAASDPAPGLLAQARSVLAEAIAATPLASPAYLDRMSNQAGLLMRLFERTGAGELLDEAIAVIGQVVAAAPADRPGLAAHESNLGRALYLRSERTGADADRAAAESAFRSAAGRLAASPAARAGAARGWASAAAARRDWPAAVQAGTQAIEMIARVNRGLARQDQERRLSASQGLASMAAACCLQAGDLARAIELLDQGRGVLFSQALDMRSDVSGLADADADLAGRFTAARSRLDAPLGDDASFGPARGARSRALAQERRRTAAAEFEDVISDIRHRPGFERFLLAPSLPQLRQAAFAGPVAAINVHAIRSDALILTAARAVTVGLPALTPDAVGEQAVKLFAAIEDAVGGGHAGSRREAQLAITDVLGWLWDNVAEPVLRQLDDDGLWDHYDGGRRLWWCPTGALAYLPLHAAGRLSAGGRGGTSRSVLDHVVSSYTPTIRALAGARQPMAPARTGPPQVTVVAMPKTPGQPDLPHALSEAKLLDAAFPGQVRTLIGPQAVRDSVLAALASRPWAHLACHGSTDIERPAESALLVQDYQTSPLTVTDIARLRLRGAELAYLSACDTAQPGVRLLDESVHLASAFQAAGYRHVIATMWPVWDSAALRAARSVYTALARTGSAADCARAVHATVRAARDRAPATPSAWASLVHYGP
jgi:tetratricopeptide (TPR) repeat protein